MLKRAFRKYLSLFGFLAQCFCLSSCNVFNGFSDDNSFTFYHFTHWVSEDGRIDFITTGTDALTGHGHIKLNDDAVYGHFNLAFTPGLISRLKATALFVSDDFPNKDHLEIAYAKQTIPDYKNSALMLTSLDNVEEDSFWNKGRSETIYASRAREQDLDARYFYNWEMQEADIGLCFTPDKTSEHEEHWRCEFEGESYSLDFGKNKSFVLEGQKIFKGSYTPTYHDMLLHFETTNPFDGKNELLLKYFNSNNGINLFPLGD